jgi:predicted metal-binding protein
MDTYPSPRSSAPMKSGKTRHFNELIDIARRKGATAAKIISADRVVIDERVRLKCEVPRCSGFGHYLTCPPYVMSVGIFAEILSSYKWCLLVQVEAKDINSTDKSKGRIDPALREKNRELHRPFRLKLLQIVEAVEAAAFKKGLYLAAGFVGGSCILCDRCVDDKSSQVCRHPFRARPAMEAVGINVIRTAKNAGLPIYLSSSQNVMWTGLILLD